MTVLAIDIGNTAVKAAVWDGAAWSPVARLRHGRVSPRVWADRLRPLVPPGGADSGVCSVVPTMTPDLAVAAQLVTGRPPLLISVTSALTSPESRVPFAVRYGTPTTLGADRLAAAVAAWTHWGGDRPVVVLDAGTAVTLDVVVPGPDGPAYLGGAIAPGPDPLRAALARGTGQLPDVPWPDRPPAIGTTTAECIQAGVAGLLADGVAGLVRRTAAALTAGGHGAPIVVATGGWAEWLGAHGVPVDAFAPLLVLDGVRILVGTGHKKALLP